MCELVWIVEPGDTVTFKPETAALWFEERGL
jgi:hypothetical protein